MRASAADVPWLQPLPDALLDPASVVAARGSLRLALVAALQHLPARQRAVLILRDVLAWRAPEVAALLGTSTAAVKSSLQRARARLDEVAPDEDLVEEPEGAADREVLDRYVAAFENADVDTLIGLLQDGVELEMPPYLEWYSGRKDVLRFLRARVHEKGTLRMLRTRANGQPAAAMYVRDADGVFRGHSVQVLTVAAGSVARITAFLDPEVLVRFGLPKEMP
ncbi:RNA polymerase subunit sigma-70 [Streptomyces ferrugineus]|uniref:RNA polymerase subunit sigma-70 n=1 Tax=Streptomyces ferrugineus TaxID=1413221 RepID=UPI002AD51C5B|nr:RNA polymerase subunit sigma-70 [Streptomyces ferrugineus]